jgi:hypothetical protein
LGRREKVKGERRDSVTCGGQILFHKREKIDIMMIKLVDLKRK